MFKDFKDDSIYLRQRRESGSENDFTEIILKKDVEEIRPSKWFKEKWSQKEMIHKKIDSQDSQRSFTRLTITQNNDSEKWDS